MRQTSEEVVITEVKRSVNEGEVRQWKDVKNKMKKGKGKEGKMR